MHQITAFLLLLLGIAQLGYGLRLFYVFLPLWYGIFGAYLGIALSQSLISQTAWGTDFFAWIVIIGFAMGLGFAAYRLEPYRRYLAGGLVGAVLGLLLASTLSVGIFLALMFAALGAIIFALLTNIMFDPIIIVGSSFAGATLILDSAFIMTQWQAFNRFIGEPVAMLFWVLFIVIGITWQFGSYTGAAQKTQTPQTI